MMQALRALWMRLMGLITRRSEDEEFDAELESHVAMHTEDAMRAGMSPEEARRQALVKLGGVEQSRQAYRERHTLPWVENLMRDVRYALRAMRRNPVFAVTAIATLALGIGATTAVFSVVDPILFRALPYAHADRIVSVGLSQPLEKQEFTLGGFFYEWQQNQKPFGQITFERGVNACSLTEANPVQLQCAQVAQNFLSTLGISPVFGRNFVPEEDVPHGPKVVLLSDHLWVERYNRDPNVLNKTIEIDQHATRIIGVLPKDFEMPRLQPFDLMVPAQTNIAAQHTANAGIGLPMWAFARLKPGVSVAEAKAEIEPLFLHTQLWIPAQFRQEFHLGLRSMRDRQMQDAYTAAWVLLAAVFAVLLIACANVAGLFSARSAARERELAVRVALGARRGRLIAQTLTEALLLAMIGAGAGCLLAEALLRIFVALAPASIPFLTKAHVDLRVIGFAVLAAMVCAGLCGILPALEKPRATALVARATKSGARAGLRRSLVTIQIAVCLVLLAGAGLLTRSFRNLREESLGMQTRNVITVSIPVSGARYPTAETYSAFFLRAEDALRRIPGVSAVAISDSMPPDANSWHNGARLDDLVVAGHAPTPPGAGGTVVRRSVTPDYFHILGIPLLEGRGFTVDERHGPESYMVLSHLLAQRLFPNEDPIGQHIQLGEYTPYLTLTGPVYTVAGVAADVKNQGIAGQPDPEMYILRRDDPADWNDHTILLLESALPAATVAPWIRAQIAQIDSTAPAQVESLTENVTRLVDRPRFETALLDFFALAGLAMVMIGLYGVIAYLAAQRTQEIGVRMALGASRLDILRLISAEGMRLIVLGGIVGLGAALAAVQLLKSLLFHVEAYDPASFIAAAALLGFVALAGTLIPARAAMRVDPMTALRVE
jgi:putative ABC transport system permease protein